MKNYIEKHLEDAFKQLGENVGPLMLEQPKDPSMGDYALTNAFIMAKRLKKAPHLLAKDWVDKLNQLEIVKTYFKLSVVGPYLNIHLKDKLLVELFSRYKEPYIQKKKQGKSMLLEFVSANPTGPLHVGHARWAVIGDMYARVSKYFLKEVSCEFYINDAGVQIENLKKSIEAKRNGEAIPEGGYQGNYIDDLVKQDKDPVLAILELQKRSLDRLRVHFDTWFSEKKLHQENRILEVVKQLKEKGALYENEEALWFRSSDYGDSKDRVLKKSDGQWTYFAVDVAYHADKVARGYDRLLNIWGADHHGYVTRIKSALTALLPDNKENNLQVELGQMVSLLKGGLPLKMSKRAGNMLFLDELLDEIGVDATRVFLAQQSVGTHSKIDLEEAKKTSMDNPVYTMQYAHARFCRVLERFSCSTCKLQQELHPVERELILHMLRFEAVLEDVFDQFSLHLLIEYALKLAKTMHRFYELCPIQSEILKIRSHRVYIVNRASLFLRFVLEELCGIKAPASM